MQRIFSKKQKKKPSCRGLDFPFYLFSLYLIRVFCNGIDMSLIVGDKKVKKTIMIYIYAYMKIFMYQFEALRKGLHYLEQKKH